MRRVRDAVRRLGVLRELASFLWEERLWWAVPLLVALALIGGLLFLTSNPAVAPFVYTLF